LPTKLRAGATHDLRTGRGILVLGVGAIPPSVSILPYPLCLALRLCEEADSPRPKEDQGLKVWGTV
jgi:hypothetical protein